MKAIIKDNGKLKQVEIFGKLKHSSWNVECVYFNTDTQQLEIIQEFNTTKYIIVNVFFFEKSPEHWIDNRDFASFDWFDVKNIISKIKNNEKIEDTIISKCKIMQNNVFIPQCIELKTQIDIDNLIYLANNFHDSYVEKITKNGKKLTIKINTTWNIKIIFTLEGEVENNLEINYGHKCGELFYATLFMQNSKIYWVNDNIENTKDFTSHTKYFCAKNISFEYEIY